MHSTSFFSSPLKGILLSTSDNCIPTYGSHFPPCFGLEVHPKEGLCQLLLFPKEPGATSKTSAESPLHILLAEDLVWPGLRRETQAFKDRNQMPEFKITGHDCRQFCLIKLGWRQTHPCLQILLLPMPPWAHQPGCSRHLRALGTLSSQPLHTRLLKDYG